MPIPHGLLIWIGFAIFVIGMLVLDLAVINRKSHVIGLRESLLQCAFWVALAMLFNLGVWRFMGSAAALNFLTGYIVEESLSIDNLFVILLILNSMAVPALYQHKVLFWGILGAMIMRAVFILAGVALVTRFEWTFYIFGAFLIFTGVRTAFSEEKEADPRKSRVLGLIRRYIPVTRRHHDGRFATRRRGRLIITPLLLALVLVELADVLFAADSIPAILGITTDPFIVFTSNIFAVLGLRSLFFALAALIRVFHYLNYGVSAILVFVGVKMVGSHWFDVPVAAALGVIAGILAFSILASIIFPPKSAALPSSDDGVSPQT